MSEKRFKTIGDAAPSRGCRLLITGDRYWTNVDKVYDVILNAVEAAGDPEKIIVVEGDARGADRIAGECAKQIGIRVEPYPAEWERYASAAGPIRNQFMLDESRRLAFADGYHLRAAVAFHANLAESKGTRDMVQRLEKAGIPVLKIT